MLHALASRIRPARTGGMFLLRFPSLRSAPPLAGTLPFGVRTFLPSHAAKGGHPARWRYQYTVRLARRGQSERLRPQRDADALVVHRDVLDALPERRLPLGEPHRIPPCEEAPTGLVAFAAAPAGIGGGSKAAFQ